MYFSVMEQEAKLEYSDVLALGFTEQFINDSVYFNRHGFEYSIICIDLKKGFRMYWSKETQDFELAKVDKNENVLSRLSIEDESVEDIIEFFKAK